MRFTHMRAEVGKAADPTRTQTLRFLVDSGALYSVVPRTVLTELGILPMTRQSFTLENGESIERDRGIALFKYGDVVTASTVIFGEEGDASLLGVVTLEELGFVVDPIRRELRPLPMPL